MDIKMRSHRELLISVAWLAFVAYMPADHGSLKPPGLQFVSINEVYIHQEKGHIPSDLKAPKGFGAHHKGTPETGGGFNPATTAVPATCNSGNASSPACFTATQQGRAK
jgi:hypothetical protein